jgi:hypothetical protein
MTIADKVIKTKSGLLEFGQAAGPAEAVPLKSIPCGATKAHLEVAYSRVVYEAASLAS